MILKSKQSNRFKQPLKKSHNILIPAPANLIYKFPNKNPYTGLISLFNMVTACSWSRSAGCWSRSQWSVGERQECSLVRSSVHHRSIHSCISDLESNQPHVHVFGLREKNGVPRKKTPVQTGGTPNSTQKDPKLGFKQRAFLHGGDNVNHCALLSKPKDRNL